jgi:hypothetical protein
VHRAHSLIGLAGAAALLAQSPAARAQVHTEFGDAANSAAAAQAIFGTSGAAPATLTTINGTFNNLQDMDAYRFRITSPTTFSASTVNAPTAGLDTILFLFSSNGIGIAMNDDQTNNTEVRSQLPPGNALYATLAPGQYVLAVSLWSNRPTGPRPNPATVGNVIFANDGEGITPPDGPGATEVFTSQDDQGQFGSVPNGSAQVYPVGYQLSLTGVAPISEPTALVLCTAALTGWTGRRWWKPAA